MKTTELKCPEGYESRIIATDEFIEKNKLELRDQKEIKERVDKFGMMNPLDFFEFKKDVLIDFLAWKDAKKFYIDEYHEKVESGEEKYHVVDTTKEATQDFLDYMVFAWMKAEDERGISASRSVQKLAAWLWALGREDLAAIIEDDDLYNPYGAPALIKVCEEMEINCPESLREFAKHYFTEE